MKFEKALLNARLVDSFRIDESMVLRRMDNGIEITYELEEDGEVLQFKSGYIARVGDYVVRNEMGRAVLVPKAEYAKRFTEIDPRFVMYVDEEQNYVTISYEREDSGELRLIASAMKPKEGSWRFIEAEDISGLDLTEVRCRLTAFELLMRKVQELDV